jgi:hypothetical protein
VHSNSCWFAVPLNSIPAKFAWSEIHPEEFPMPPPFTKTIAIIGGTGIVHGLPRLPLADVVVHRNVAVTWGANSGRVLHYVEGYAGTVRVIVLPRCS